MRTLTHLIVGGLAATTLLATTAVTASAQSDTIKDKRADVVQYDGYGDDSGTVLDRADSIATGIDATSATVKYGKKTLRVTMKFAELGKGSIQVYGGIRVKGSKSWPTYQIISDGSKRRVAVYNRNYSKFLCTGKLTRKNGTRGQHHLPDRQLLLQQAQGHQGADRPVRLRRRPRER
ncbi:hypothetical protein [Aeromicrobium sp. UC242_57]|uniref:hypothetical protein n=1 Tax=Aeromicrobium sp. UC242_57 TaxID=3374624 RepID=UPI0037B7975A